jgi:hypothetical protein
MKGDCDETQWKVDYEAWVEAWRREHPLPRMSKKARWRIENAAWLEMQRQAKGAERAAKRAEKAARREEVSPLSLMRARRGKASRMSVIEKSLYF